MRGPTLVSLIAGLAVLSAAFWLLEFFPFIDLAFGTFYMPIDRQPQRFGIVNDDVPEGLLGQLVYPFRRKQF